MDIKKLLEEIMSDKTILSEDEQLEEKRNAFAEQIRGALGRVEMNFSEWIEGTLVLAATLKQARDSFPSNQQFAVWLAANSLDSESARSSKPRGSNRHGD